MAFDVGYVRGLFPRSATAGFTSIRRPGCRSPTRCPRPSTGFRQFSAPPSPLYPTGRATADVTDRARRAIADLVGGDPAGWSSATPALADIGAHRVAAVLAQSRRRHRGQPHRRRGEHHPWLRLAKRSGWNTRWAEIDVETGEPPSWQYEKLLTGPVSVVTVSMASTVTGVLTDLQPIAREPLTRARCSSSTPPAPHRSTLDIKELGADVVVVSAQRWVVRRLRRWCSPTPAGSTPSNRSALTRRPPAPPASNPNGSAAPSSPVPLRLSTTWPASTRIPAVNVGTG